MATSYDEIWTSFLTNCKTFDINLPQEDERIYEAIRNAIMHVNNRLRLNIVCDNDYEQVDQELTDDLLLIIAHYLRWIFLQNEITHYETTLQPFQKDVGFKNFASQMTALRLTAQEEERLIERIILNQEEDWL